MDKQLRVIQGITTTCRVNIVDAAGSPASFGGSATVVVNVVDKPGGQKLSVITGTSFAGSVFFSITPTYQPGTYLAEAVITDSGVVKYTERFYLKVIQRL